MEKYKLTENTINLNGKTLYQIESLIDFRDVKKGDLGGYIESEKNLSQNGNCWVYDNAWVYGDAFVFDNVKICGNARVYGDALVYNDARVFGDALVYGNARVYGDAFVFDNAKIYGNAWVCDDAKIYGNARVYGDTLIFGDAEVHGDTFVEYDINNIWRIKEVKMELYQILANAKRERKGDYKIYSHYVNLIYRSKDVLTVDEIDDAIFRLMKILKI